MAKTSKKHFDEWVNSMPEKVEPYLIPIKEGKNPDEGKAPDYLEITKRALQEHGLGWKKYRELKDEHEMVKLKHLAELTGEEVKAKSSLRVSSWRAPWAKLSVKEGRQRIAGGKNLALVTRGVIAVMDIDDSSKARKILPEELMETLTVETRTGNSHLYYLNGGVNNSDIQGVVELRAKWRYVLTSGSYVPPGDSDGNGLYKVSRARELRTLKVDDLPVELRTGKSGTDRNIGRVLKDYSPAVLDDKVKTPCPFFDADSDNLSSIYLDFHNFARSLVLSRLQITLENILAIGVEGNGYGIRLIDGEVALVDGENSIRLASVEVKTSQNSVKPVKAAALALKKGIPSIVAEVQTGDVHLMNRESAKEIIERAEKQLTALTRLERAGRKIPDRHTCKRCSNTSCRYHRSGSVQRTGKELVEKKTEQLEKCPSPTVDNITKVIEQILKNEGYSILKLGSPSENSEEHGKTNRDRTTNEKKRTKQT